jgi:hypothetical protein
MRRALALRAHYRRAEQLCRLLAPATPQTTARILGSLDGMRARAAASAQPWGRLAGLASFALAAAAADYLLGRAGDGTRPTTAELAELARWKEAPFHAEAVRISRALAEAALPPRPPVSPERRKATADQ